MKTVEVLNSLGLHAAAANLQTYGAKWLEQHRKTVEKVGRAGGQALLDAIEEDLRLAPSPVPPTVDAVLPFHSGDSQWLRKGLLSLLKSRHVDLRVHVVADGCEFPELPNDPRILKYSTSGGWGPYVIANSLFREGYLRAEWMAVQDADDISLPDRLWSQIARLEKEGADMISSAALNFRNKGDESEAIRAKLKWQKVVRPGTVYESVKLGQCVNPTRTMRTDFFASMGGFSDVDCSGDFEFDNRCRYTGQKIIDDQTVLALRRLHGSSLSHGVFPMDSPRRQEAQALVMRRQEQLKRNPSIDLAQSFGNLWQIREPLTVESSLE